MTVCIIGQMDLAIVKSLIHKFEGFGPPKKFRGG